MSETRNGLFVEYCAKDFLDGTQQLDVWEEIAYRRVVDMIYATNDTLADDDRKLAWMTKVGSRWKKIRESLIAAGKIEAVEGRITNARCRKELEKSAKKIAQKVGAGIASAATGKSLQNLNRHRTDVPDAVLTGDRTNYQPTNPSKKREAIASLNSEIDEIDRDGREWYAAFPRKADPGRAAKAYRAARKIASAADLLAGALRYTAECDGKDPQFVKMPATWLNARSWENLPLTPASNGHGRPQQNTPVGGLIEGAMRAIERREHERQAHRRASNGPTLALLDGE